MASLFGALGLVFFAFGLLSVMLLLAGAPPALWWIGANLLIGLALMIGAGVTNFESLRERMRSGEGRRIGKYGSSALAQALIVLAIVGALGFLANRYHSKCDASEAKVHSISDQTAEAARGLGAGRPGGRVLPKLDQANARALLDKYQYASRAREGRVRRSERAPRSGREARRRRPRRSARACST